MKPDEGKVRSLVANPRVWMSRRVYGYRPACGQYQIALRIELPQLKSFDVAAANAFLSEKLECSSRGAVLFRIGRKGKGLAILKRFVDTAVAIAQHALENASFPAFAPTVASRIAPSKFFDGGYDLTLLVPSARHLRQEVIPETYALACRIALVFQSSAHERDRLDALVDEDLSNLIETNARAFGGFSGKFILRAAFDRGIPLLARGNGLYQLGLGRKQELFDRSSMFEDSAIGRRLCADKLVAIQHMKRAGIPVPRSVRLMDDVAAADVARDIGYPVVVKPANMARGKGVTVDIETDAALEQAVEHAKQFSPHILIENRVPGICHRVLVFRDEVVFAYARHPQAVQGDGSSTIAELVEQLRSKAAGKARHLRGKPPVLDAEAIAVLAAQSHTPQSVLPAEELAFLRRNHSPDEGGFERIVTDVLHPENVDLAKRAARLFGLQMSGVDLITTDATRPWYETKAAVNEVNSKPQVGRHTAGAIVRRCFPKDKGIIRVDCFIGGDAAMRAAREQLAKGFEERVPTYLTSHDETLGPDGERIRLEGLEGAFDRVEFLLAEPGAAAIIVVLQTDEFLRTGLPFPCASRVEIIDHKLHVVPGPNALSPADVAIRLEHIIREVSF